MPTLVEFYKVVYLSYIFIINTLKEAFSKYYELQEVE